MMRVRALKECFDGQVFRSKGEVFEWPHAIEAYLEKVEDSVTDIPVEETQNKKSKGQSSKSDPKTKTGDGDVI